MLGRLTQAGWEVTGEPDAADLLLVNTCGFIEAACKEAVDTILELARVKENARQAAWWWPAAWCSAMARSWRKNFRKSTSLLGSTIFRPCPIFWTGLGTNGRRAAISYCPAIRLRGL